jgi:hypothetical protein
MISVSLYIKESSVRSSQAGGGCLHGGYRGLHLLLPSMRDTGKTEGVISSFPA